MTTDNFEAIKAEILNRAKMQHACIEQYGRAYRSKNLAKLMQVIKDNFHWACRNGVVTPDIIKQYRDDFAANDIYLNDCAVRGFLLCDIATVSASGNATVMAYGNATVMASDNATVSAWGKATVSAFDSATVSAFDSATVSAWGNTRVNAYDNTTVEAYGRTTVKARDNATVKAFDSATVKACGNSAVEAYGNATITAYGNARVSAFGNTYCISLYPIECKLNDNAIYRLRSENTIFFANDEIKFVKQ